MLFCIYANAQICSRAVARSWVSAGSIIQIVIFAQQVHVKGGDPRFEFGWPTGSSSIHDYSYPSSYVIGCQIDQKSFGNSI